MRYIIPALLTISAVYGEAAVLTHLLYAAANPRPLPEASPLCFAVLVPYGLLFLADQVARDRLGRLIMGGAVIVVTLAAGFIYADSFRRRTEADMYSLVYVFVPAVQFVVAALVLGIVVWRRRSLGGYAGA